MIITRNHKERQVLKRIIERVSEQYHPRRGVKDLCSFMQAVGNRANGELMLYGRAVNQSKTYWKLGEDVNYEEISLNTQAASSSPKDNPDSCPMMWVSEFWEHPHNGYSTKRSSFWRVARDVTTALRICDRDDTRWPSSLVWSNLYKVAPYSGGNPSSTLADIQLPLCKELVSLEVDSIRPKRILFLTGLNWFNPFLDIFSIDKSAARGTYVKLVGKDSRFSTQIVVAVHPQGKPQAAVVREIVESFESLNNV